MFCLKLYGLSPSGKEKITTLYFPMDQVEHMAVALQNAVEQQKRKLTPEETDKEKMKYIG
jgi:hypothetical protein